MTDLTQTESYLKNFIKSTCPTFSFAWSRAKTVHGQCFHSRKLIKVSKPFAEIATLSQLHNLITHEIAHAMVGPRHGHDEVWRSTHIKLGGDGKRCSSVRVPRPKKKDTWKLSCVNSCFEVGYKRRPKTAFRVCRRCKGGIIAKPI
jgi:predicted SprT family Zn-dependent metalloprotease